MCSFCDDLKEWVMLNRRSNAEMVNESDWIETARHRYRLRLSAVFVANGRDKGGLTSGHYHIKFCPECGRKIKKGELDDRAERR